MISLLNGVGTALRSIHPNHSHTGASHDDVKFKALLERDLPQAQDDAQRSYAFSELGMFGNGRTDVASKSDELNTNMTSETDHRADHFAHDSANEPTLDDISNGGRARHPHQRQRSSASVRITLDTPQARFARTGGTVAPGPEVPSVGDYAEDMESVGERQGYGRLPVRVRSDTPSSTLTVNGADDALNIVARTTADADSEPARVRQTLDEVAAEFGMKLANVQFNGASVGQISQVSQGGSHGDRAR